MKYIYREKDDDFYHDADVERIIQIFEDRGHELSYNDAKQAWQARSDDAAASWLMLDDDDDLVFLDVSHHLEETE